MLMLVLANNYVLLFVGWEGVGLCSYLLIGFYFHKKSAGDAGKKAFIVNRIGDAGFILGHAACCFGLVGHGALHGRERGPAQRHASRDRGIRRRSARSRCCCSSARPASRRSFRCTSGCRTPWKARRRSPP